MSSEPEPGTGARAVVAKVERVRVVVVCGVEHPEHIAFGGNLPY
ncbi:hypothetical protein L083_2590 [Actinoplanes sp. N902-109]|nr:hypothetical protein L083_2590 [Actinoplanes sp. N902-109]